VKVATNMLAAATVQTLAEALALVKKSGLPAETLAAALENHGVRSGLTDMKLPGMLKSDFEPHFSVKHMLKDMQIALNMAESHSVELPVTTAAARVLYDAANRGWADLDFSSVLKFYSDETEEVVTASTADPAPVESGDSPVKTEPEAAEPAHRPGLMRRLLFGKKD
jgi:3-hydroxyisobutyrate dehydrogenase-like beta-hydroxyacid dehydrogenase